MVEPRPMFPLGTVLFPHAPLRLHVFEPRYRALVRDVLADDGTFGVVLIERGSEVGGGDTRFAIGTLARVVRASETPDGRFAIAAVGTRRIRVLRWLPEDPYPRAEVEPYPPASAPGAADPPESPLTVAARDRAARVLREALVLGTRLARLRDGSPTDDGLPPSDEVEHDEDVSGAARDLPKQVADAWATARAHEPERSVFELAALAPIGPLDAQRVLEVPGTVERAARLAALLTASAADLRALLARGDTP